MNLKSLVLCAVFAALCALARGQDRPLLTFDEALAAARDGNPALAAAAFAREAADDERRAAIGLRFPQIDLMGGYALLDKDIGLDANNLKSPIKNLLEVGFSNGILPPELSQPLDELTAPLFLKDWNLRLQRRSLATITAGVTLPIWMGGRIGAANRAAKIRYRSAEVAAAEAEQEVITQLVERYFGLALALEVVRVRRQAVEGVGLHLRDAEALERNGMIARSERLYVEAKLVDARRELEDAISETAVLRSALANTMGGREAGDPLTPLFVLDHTENLAFFQELAERRNPQFELLRAQRQLAVEGVRAKRAEFLPQVVAMGGASLYNYQVSGLMPRWAVGVGVRIPIFNGLGREYGYRAARRTSERVSALVQQAGEDISTLVEKLYNTLMDNARQVESYEASIRFATEYLRMIDAGFRAGVNTATELIDAELNLSRVRTERLRAAYNYDCALAALLAAAGASVRFTEYQRRPEARRIGFIMEDKK